MIQWTDAVQKQFIYTKDLGHTMTALIHPFNKAYCVYIIQF